MEDGWSVKTACSSARASPWGICGPKKAYKNCRVRLEYRWPKGFSHQQRVYTRITEAQALAPLFRDQLQHARPATSTAFTACSSALTLAVSAA